jgi:hypothetical protein
MPRSERGRVGRGLVMLAAPALAAALAASCAAQQQSQPQQAPAPAQPAQASLTDPRAGLRPGLTDAGEASWNMRLLVNQPRPAGFFNPEDPDDGNFSNTDLAFQRELVFVGNYHGFNVYDISEPTRPRLRVSVVCPGGQGDVSVFGNLLFLSVEQPRGRVDCGVEGAEGVVNPERFRGVRIFDIGNLDAPRQVAAVQTCRGSHTHTLVTDPRDRENVYVYVSGTSTVRSPEELPGCSPAGPEEDPNTSFFRIEVIRVPLAAPQTARVINAPRIFADAQGNIAGLWPGGEHGPGTQSSRLTNQCHDITAYPELGLAAGACSGNGIVLDIRDPANPRRIDEVIDPNFAYWHSATFNNDGTKILFTDEWGGGRGARCRVEDPMTWGANAIFDVVEGRMRLAGYYKIPAAQRETENCVAHNGSLVPVPGRDIKVQAWYQGGVSVFDFTDGANAFEIAYFDRGPVSATELWTGGYWSTYWYNGYIYGAEIIRGLDVLELTPGEHLTQNELDAAKLVRWEEFNPQMQPRMTWPAHPSVARAYVDQLARGGVLPSQRATQLAAQIDARRGAELTAAAAQLDADARRAGLARADVARMHALAEVLRELGERE